MTLRIHMSIHNDDLHKTTAKRNLAGGVAGLDSSIKIENSLYKGLKKLYEISNNILHSHDVNAGTQSSTYVKLKTITINTLYPSPITLRIYFGLYSSCSIAASPAKAKIYKNGNPVGIERTNAWPIYQTFTEDLSFSNGDTIELWGLHSYGTPCWCTVSNFKVLGDENMQLLDSAINNSNVGLDDPFVGTNS
jgi:hypothetical protein